MILYYKNNKSLEVPNRLNDQHGHNIICIKTFSTYSFAGLKSQPSYSSKVVVYFTDLVNSRFVFHFIEAFSNCHVLNINSSTKSIVAARLLFYCLALPLLISTKLVKFICMSGRSYNLPDWLWVFIGNISSQVSRNIGPDETGLTGFVVCYNSRSLKEFVNIRSIFSKYLLDEKFLYDSLTHTQFGELVWKEVSKGDPKIYTYHANPRLLMHINRLLGDIPITNNFDVFFDFIISLIGSFGQYVKYDYPLTQMELNHFSTSKVLIHKFRSHRILEEVGERIPFLCYFINYSVLKTIANNASESVTVIFLGIFSPDFHVKMDGGIYDFGHLNQPALGDVVIDTQDLKLGSLFLSLFSIRLAPGGELSMAPAEPRNRILGGSDIDKREFSTSAQTGLKPANTRGTFISYVFGIPFYVGRPVSRVICRSRGPGKDTYIYYYPDS